MSFDLDMKNPADPVLKVLFDPDTVSTQKEQLELILPLCRIPYDGDFIVDKTTGNTCSLESVKSFDFSQKAGLMVALFQYYRWDASAEKQRHEAVILYEFAQALQEQDATVVLEDDLVTINIIQETSKGFLYCHVCFPDPFSLDEHFMAQWSTIPREYRDTIIRKIPKSILVNGLVERIQSELEQRNFQISNTGRYVRFAYDWTFIPYDIQEEALRMLDSGEREKWQVVVRENDSSSHIYDVKKTHDSLSRCM